jgi:hypothetical protein
MSRTFLSPLLERPPRTDLQLRNARTGGVIATTLELAADSRTRRKGLLGRPSLPPRYALIIAPSGGVHTVGMKFRIDVIFVSTRGLVIKICRDVGSVPSLDLAPGDLVEIAPRADSSLAST